MTKYAVQTGTEVHDHRVIRRTRWRHGRAQSYLKCIDCGATGEGPGHFREIECEGGDSA